MDVYGRGKQRGMKIGEVTYDELPKELIFTVVREAEKDFVMKIIMQAARTGHKGAFGDGKIFVSPVEEVYTVSSGLKEDERTWKAVASRKRFELSGSRRVGRAQRDPPVRGNGGTRCTRPTLYKEPLASEGSPGDHSHEQDERDEAGPGRRRRGLVHGPQGRRPRQGKGRIPPAPGSGGGPRRGHQPVVAGPETGAKRISRGRARQGRSHDRQDDPRREPHGKRGRRQDLRMPVREAVRIRTGERDDAALDETID